VGEDERDVTATEGGVEQLNEGFVVRHGGPLAVDGTSPSYGRAAAGFHSGALS
jgi:hypothetical protein